VVDNRVLRQNTNLINENDLEEVYVVGQITKDQNSDSSEETDTEHDQRRLVLPFYDAVSDSADLRQAMDPFSAETGTNSLEDSTLTPASSNAPEIRLLELFLTIMSVPNLRNNQELYQRQRRGLRIQSRLMFLWRSPLHF
jgi:hypothetical protein